MYQTPGSPLSPTLHDTPTTAHLVRMRTSLPTLQRTVDEALRAGARVLAYVGVGALASLPFLVTLALGG